MELDNELVFKVFRQSKTVRLQFEEGGPVQEYTLVSLLGAEKEEFQAFTAGRTKYKDGVPVGLTKTEGVDTRLLSLALRDPAGQKVPEQEFKKWPVEVTTGLLKIVVKMNGLGKDEAEEVKN